MAFEAFIVDIFSSALSDSSDVSWPRTDRFHAGMTKIESTYLIELKTWLKKQQPRAAEAAATAMGDSDDDGNDSDVGPGAGIPPFDD